jgi:hypothetical protein
VGEYVWAYIWPLQNSELSYEDFAVRVIACLPLDETRLLALGSYASFDARIEAPMESWDLKGYGPTIPPPSGPGLNFGPGPGGGAPVYASGGLGITDAGLEAVREALWSRRNEKRFWELRVQHRGEPYRIFYAFDPRRAAILLLGGNKVGDDLFYERMVPLADRIYDQHLDQLDREKERPDRGE